MTATPPAPRADDGGAAFAEAVDAFACAYFDAEYRGPTARSDAARAHVLALHAATVARAEAAERALAHERAEAADLERSFDLRHAADMRAIAAWREAAPGRELRQPGHEDLCVFLLDALDGCKAAMRADAQRLHDGAADIIAKAEADADAAGYARALAEERQPRGVVSAMVADDRLAAAHGRGYARALADVDAACSALAGDDEHESIALWRLAPYGWRAEVAAAESCAVGVGQTATAAIIDLLDCDRAAADMAVHMDAPALVNGGPPTDALDDGR